MRKQPVTVPVPAGLSAVQGTTVGSQPISTAEPCVHPKRLNEHGHLSR